MGATVQKRCGNIKSDIMNISTQNQTTTQYRKQKWRTDEITEMIEERKQ